MHLPLIFCQRIIEAWVHLAFTDFSFGVGVGVGVGVGAGVGVVGAGDNESFGASVGDDERSELIFSSLSGLTLSDPFIALLSQGC